MATASPSYNPGLFSTIAPPAVIDGTGLSSVPLTILNGKSLSGVEVQVTGTAPSGFVLNDAAGVRRGFVGLAVSASDWVAGATANDVVLGAATAGARVQIMAGSAAIMTLASTGVISINGQLNTQASTIAIGNSTSLTTVALQVNGDANTGIGQIGGADTLSVVAGGVQSMRVSASNVLIIGDLQFPANGRIVLDTVSGTKIGTGTNQLLGFYNATPVDQPATVADPSGGVVIDAESRTAIIAIIDRLQELGLIA